MERTLSQVVSDLFVNYNESPRGLINSFQIIIVIIIIIIIIIVVVVVVIVVVIEERR